MPITGIVTLNMLSIENSLSPKEVLEKILACLSTRNVPEVTAIVPEDMSQSVFPHFEGETKTSSPVLKNRLKSEPISLNCGKENELNIVINKKICFRFIG